MPLTSRPKLHFSLVVTALSLALLTGTSAEAACGAAPGASTNGALRFVGASHTWTTITNLGTPAAGDIVYDTTNNALSVCNGTTWTTVGSAGVSEGGAGCSVVGAASEPGSGSAGTACTDGSKFIGRYAGFNYFATASDDSTSSTWSSAVTLCSGLNRHGKTDWFLPTLAVLQMMYENRTQIGGFSSAWYWSASSYADYSDAWGIDFTSGNQFNIGSSTSLARVRCARRA
jgi:hypothetical protein